MKKRIRYIIVGIIVMLLAGFVYAWSVMAKSIGASRPTWTVTQLSLTFTLVMAFFCIGGLIAGFLGKRFTPRSYVIASAVLFLAGFLLAGMAGESIILLYLGFGVLCGLAAGIVYNAVMSVLSAWFPDVQGLISGVMMMGFGISSFIIGKVFAAVTPSDGSNGWVLTFRYMAVILFVVLLLCSFFLKRPSEDYQAPAGTKKKMTKEPAMEVGPGEMMRMPLFWFYYLWAVLAGAAGLAVVSQGGGIAAEVGATLSDGTIATTVGLLSLFNGIGRVIFGTVFDKKGCRFTMVLDMLLFFAALFILLLAMAINSFALVVVGFIFCGLAYGGTTPLSSAIMSDFFGRKHYSKNFSVVTTTLMIASFSSTIAGRFYDLTNSYRMTVYLALGLAVAAFAISFAVKRPVGSSKGEA